MWELVVHKCLTWDENPYYVITGIKLGGMLLLNKLSVFVSTIYEYQNIAYIWFDILNAMMSN